MASILDSLSTEALDVKNGGGEAVFPEAQAYPGGWISAAEALLQFEEEAEANQNPPSEPGLGFRVEPGLPTGLASDERDQRAWSVVRETGLRPGFRPPFRTRSTSG